MLQKRRLYKSFLYYTERILFFCTLFYRTRLSPILGPPIQARKRAYDLGILPNKPVVEVRKAQEHLDLTKSLRGRPLLDSSDPAPIYRDAYEGHDVPKELYLSSKEGTLLCIRI